MRYRTLGKTGWKVSAVSMGCWGIGGQWGEVSEKQATDTIEAACDAGVNLFDTADAYGMGQSEIYTGRALHGRRGDVYIATKVGNWGRRFGDPPQFKTIWSIVNCCHASLHRLGTDYIDLYQCHVPSPEHPELFVEAFELLKQQGKIRHYAISTNSVDALKAINVNGQCASCQIHYSLLNRRPENDILPYCLDNAIGVLLRGPIAQGILADKFTEATRFDDIVRQSWNPDGSGRADFLARLDTVAKLRDLVPAGSTMVDLALKFTLAHPAVTCPIPGMKSPEQARQNAAAGDGELDRAVLRRIDAICPPGH
ncbi:MAG: aldo/keto reductase [Planctomycetes bacterium]|nr:aldo/keto reductase [Planctomycetota bacterium]